MDWTGKEQILLLFQSVIPGIIIGVLFDINNEMFHNRRNSVGRFAMDALWGGMASLITFFAALVLADGQLHPVLFVGGLLGFFAEHCTIGRLLHQLINKSRTFFEQMRRRLSCIWLKYQAFIEKRRKTG